MDLEFTINNQTLKRTDTTHPVDLSNEYLKCQFDFLSDDWEDLGKFAIFRTGDKNYRVAIAENECYVPYDVLQHNKFLLTVYGVYEDIRITTNYLWVHLLGSGFTTEYDESGYFNPDMTEQIWLAMEGKVDKVTGKALSTHDFTDYYKNFIDGFDGDIEAFLEEHKEEIEALITSEVLDGKADKVHSHLKSDITDFAHNHDDRYYTETETDTLLTNKSDTGHTHTEADITDLQNYALESDVYSKAEVDALIHDLNNNIKINSTEDIIQTDETLELYAYAKSNGKPVINKKIHFYEVKEE